MNKRTFFLLAILFTAARVSAQLADLGANPFMSDVNGRPMYLQTNYRAEGSPYYQEAYLLADLTSLQGKLFPRVKVRFNILTNELFYLDDKGADMLAALPLRRIRFLGLGGDNGTTDKVLESVGSQPLNAPNTPVYEKTDTGRITVLKQIKVTYTDNKEYNQSTIVRNFKHKESWHLLLTDGSVVKFETGRDAMLAVLAAKQKEVAVYIEKENLKCRSIDDCRQLIRYYNTLF